MTDRDPLERLIGIVGMRTQSIVKEVRRNRERANEMAMHLLLTLSAQHATAFHLSRVL